jgi:hypothetical protein
MKMPTVLKVPLEVIINGEFKWYKTIELGKITNSYFSKGQLFVNVTIDSKKKKLFQKLVKILKEF